MSGGSHAETPKEHPWSKHCRTFIVKDGHGAVKELVFPKALDLDRPKRDRTTFSNKQLKGLEDIFQQNQYLVGKDRTCVAKRLGLTETQVKVWFQNRRTKFKKDNERHLDTHDSMAESKAAQNVLKLLEYNTALNLTSVLARLPAGSADPSLQQQLSGIGLAPYGDSGTFDEPKAGSDHNQIQHETTYFSDKHENADISSCPSLNDKNGMWTERRKTEDMVSRVPATDTHVDMLGLLPSRHNIGPSACPGNGRASCYSNPYLYNTGSPTSLELQGLSTTIPGPVGVQHKAADLSPENGNSQLVHTTTPVVMCAIPVFNVDQIEKQTKTSSAKDDTSIDTNTQLPDMSDQTFSQSSWHRTSLERGNDLSPDHITFLSNHSPSYQGVNGRLLSNGDIVRTCAQHLQPKYTGPMLSNSQETVNHVYTSSLPQMSLHQHPNSSRSTQLPRPPLTHLRNPYFQETNHVTITGFQSLSQPTYRDTFLIQRYASPSAAMPGWMPYQTGFSVPYPPQNQTTEHYLGYIGNNSWNYRLPAFSDLRKSTTSHVPRN